MGSLQRCGNFASVLGELSHHRTMQPHVHRRRVIRVSGIAKLGRELSNDDLDTRLKALRQQAGTTTARSELDALKAARAQQAGQVKKSI